MYTILRCCFCIAERSPWIRCTYGLGWLGRVFDFSMGCVGLGQRKYTHVHLWWFSLCLSVGSRVQRRLCWTATLSVGSYSSQTTRRPWRVDATDRHNLCRYPQVDSHFYTGSCTSQLCCCRRCHSHRCLSHTRSRLRVHNIYEWIMNERMNEWVYFTPQNKGPYQLSYVKMKKN